MLILREADIVTTESIANMLCYLSWKSQSHSAITLEDLQVRTYISVVKQNILIVWYSNAINASIFSIIFSLFEY